VDAKTEEILEYVQDEFVRRMWRVELDALALERAGLLGRGRVGIGIGIGGARPCKLQRLVLGVSWRHHRHGAGVAGTVAWEPKKVPIVILRLLQTQTHRDRDKGMCE